VIKQVAKYIKDKQAKVLLHEREYREMHTRTNNFNLSSAIAIKIHSFTTIRRHEVF